MDINTFSVFPGSDKIYKPDMINTSKNIIAGPNTDPSKSKMLYWNHSKGLKEPMEREEQPFPVQGNIGSLLRNEAMGQYSNCSRSINEISGSPNCTESFYPDEYTLSNTCGRNCTMTSPESFGDKDFGFQGNNKYTNAHGIHAYKNIRAGSEGQSSQSGCYEFIPGTSRNELGTCMMKQDTNYKQVGDWTKLDGMEHLVKSSWSPWGQDITNPPPAPASSAPPTSTDPPASSMQPPSSSR